MSEPHFKYGVNYFFGKYQGKPQSVQQNAIAAIYQKRQGVELWRIMKSVAFEAPDRGLFIVHVRGDRKIDEDVLSSVLEVEKDALASADVSSLGVEYGTVNPFISNPTIAVSHIFDRDLIEGPEYPNDDIVFTSSGDSRFYVGFDIRRYLLAISEPQAILEITRSDLPRIFARRRIEILGGDSGIDTFDFSKVILDTLRQRLEERGAYYGDRSLARVDAKSDPALAGSIDTVLYGTQLRAHLLEIVDQHQGPDGQTEHAPIVSFSSMAMHGIGGRILRTLEGISYIGPQEALGRILAGVERRSIEITYIALLGLASAYDSERSAFAGELLQTVLPVDANVLRQISDLVQNCKKAKADSRDFYEIVKKMLQRATRGKIDTLKSKNIVIILGASELESLVSADHRTPDEFTIIRSNEPAIIAAEIARSPDSIRLLFIRPGLAVADMIAGKALGLELES